nr:energy-coupling factor transporter transmembrane component T [Microbacterium sp. Root166]
MTASEMNAVEKSTVEPLTAAQGVHAPVDPYAQRVAASPVRFLYPLNPLAKLAAPIPAIVLLVFVRDLATPAAFLLLAYAILLVGVSFTRRLVLLLVALPLGAALIGLSFSLWTDASRVDQSVVIWQIGEWTLYGGALEVGMATGLRIAAIVALTLIAGLSTAGPDVVRASVQQLRVPYRIGYTALAAFRFVPRFGHELDVIRQAHRVRGAHGGRGPFAAVARWFGYIVPLLAGAIRHAERVALAMDARAFGAYPDRTERHLVPFRARDVVFIVLLWAVSAIIAWTLFPWGLA